MRRRDATKLTAMAVSGMCALPYAVAAQGAVQTRLGVTAGRATDALGTSSSAVTVAPALLLRPNPHLAAELGLQGTRFANEQWAVTTTGSAGFNAPLGPWLALATSGFGAWTVTGYDGRYTTVGAVPALEARAGRYTMFAGAQVARGSSSVPEAIAGSPFPFGDSSPTSRMVSTSRTLAGAVFGGGARFASADMAGYAGYREERSRVGDASFVDRSLSANAGGGRVSYAATIGARQAGGASETFGSGSITVDVLRGAALQVAGSRYPASYLTGTVAGSALSIGMVLRTGRTPGAGSAAYRAPVLRGVPAPARGMQRLVLEAPRAARVEIAGDWNGWRPEPAARAPDGTWYADVQVAPGRYRYAFRIDGSRWAVPDGVAAEDDGFGGRSAWLTVK